ncbi:MAG: HAMP domain-containing sensor histidine kinase [Gammaproteobacteria bacterium]
MFRNTLIGWDKKQLRFYLFLFFLALSIPTVVLIYQAYSQLKWQAFHRHQLMAEELASRIDQRLLELVDIEESRSFTDYSFLNVIGDPAANFLQRSSLSDFPVSTVTPGLLGYFQVDAQGLLTTPLLPADEQQSLKYGISEIELNQRRELQNRIQDILSQNSLVQKHAGGKARLAQSQDRNDKRSDEITLGGVIDSSKGISSSYEYESGNFYSNGALEEDEVVLEETMPQAAFDQLYAQGNKQQQKAEKKNPLRTLGRVEDLKLDSTFEDADRYDVPASSKNAVLEKRKKRKEQSALPEQKISEFGNESELNKSIKEKLHINLFESEIDPFNISLLNSGHFVLFRKVWRDGQRYIQGVLIEPDKLVRDVIEKTFRSTNLSQMSNLAVAYQGDLLAVISGQASGRYISSAEELQGSLLYQKHLSAPLSDIELIFSINHLPAGPAGTVINWVAIILVIVLCGGFLLMYRMGLGQINLTRQQQDFVSAVSHELKTPITSIRMYGEMLREGWAEEDKKKTYYNYIHDESERLSRLINNVLQLARMTRNELQVELKPASINEILDMIRSKISSYVERAGYRLNILCNEETDQTVIQVDMDYFNQIMINLVDNAIKFSSISDKPDIDINCQVQQDGSVLFAVRDYGPGVARDQMRKIFKLFYRSENELTRETVGTGLALVHQLAQAMNAKVDVINREIGAEFRVKFPYQANTVDKR